ncbi:MAG: 2'-5' RNA ligase family protein [Propionibacterium sp.]|uniref:2'-5' RNA ligase family protein n=2 Tax=Propionibacterium freudenreichii TaxID=1744 RepID=UPI0021A43F00|nr:2'-5' RNA ligase family protein [Propionibacterium freudenreichii]MDN6799435.1 2'-5' RNA ligase family protein [Propionibacterium sp.]
MADVDPLASMDPQWRGHAVLLVPVPELEPFARERTRFYDRSFLSDDPRFFQAHITVLAPFMAVPERSRIAPIVDALHPFDFELSQLGVFPDGLIHLRPEPDAPLRDAIGRAVEAFPEVRGYGHPAPVPHLSLDRLSPQVSVQSTRALLGKLVPAHCRAERIQLCWYESDHCRVLDEWELR